MDIEYIVHDGEDVIALAYKHETLGRIVVVRNGINPDSILSIVSMNGKEEKSIGIKEFILSVLPIEE